MATLQNSSTPEIYRIVHPLDDQPEIKRQSEGLGPIEMTWAARISLRILRGYLIFMCALLAYHVLDLAGLLQRL